MDKQLNHKNGLLYNTQLSKAFVKSNFVVWNDNTSTGLPCLNNVTFLCQVSTHKRKLGPERNLDSFISGTTTIMRETLATKMTLIPHNQALARLTRDFPILLNPSSSRANGLRDRANQAISLIARNRNIALISSHDPFANTRAIFLARERRCRAAGPIIISAIRSRSCSRRQYNYYVPRGHVSV